MKFKRKKILKILLIGSGILILCYIFIPSFIIETDDIYEIATIQNLQSLYAIEKILKDKDFDCNGENDFWVGDLAGMHFIKDDSGNSLITRYLAKADINPLKNYNLPVKPGHLPLEPKQGYYYMMMKYDDKGQKYDDKSTHRNKENFAIISIPAYSRYLDHLKVLIINEKGKVYGKIMQKKDNVWQANLQLKEELLKWPTDLKAEGWQFIK